MNGLAIDLKSPPKGLVVREAIGLLTGEAIDGQIVYRTTTRILETRATITPGGDYLLMFPEGAHYATAKRPRQGEFAHGCALVGSRQDMV